MSRKFLTSGFLAVMCLMSGIARAQSEIPVVGQWVYKGDGVRIDMDFKKDGHCTATAVSGEKTSVVTGTFRRAKNELTITPNKGKPISYGLKMTGEQMILSGGDFGAGSALTFSKRSGLADAAPDVRPPAPPANADKPGKAPDAPKRDDAAAAVTGLPGGKWDTHVLEQHFTILKTSQDSVKSTVTFLLQRTDEGYLGLVASFYDEDDVKLGTTYLAFDPSVAQTAKGERTRATVPLLAEDKMKTCVKVVIVKQ